MNFQQQACLCKILFQPPRDLRNLRTLPAQVNQSVRAEKFNHPSLKRQNGPQHHFGTTHLALSPVIPYNSDQGPSLNSCLGHGDPD